MILPITSTLAALLAALMLPLTLAVSMKRVTLGLSEGNIAKYPTGDGGNDALIGRIRALGNFTEYVPIALILFALMELQGAPNTLLWAVGGAFTAGRLIHAIACIADIGFPPPRGLAMFATYAALGVPAWWLLSNAWG